MTSSYWHSVPFISALVLAIAYFNSRRFVLKNVPLYWFGIAIFLVGGIFAAGYHVGSTANAWGLISTAGWFVFVLAGFGWPPRWPKKRDGWY